MPVLFISHSSADKADAERLRDELCGLGFANVFIDNHSILPGQEWETILYQRLRSCAAVIALISAHFHASKWCFAELTHARALGRHIIPLLLEGAALPDILNDTQSQSARVNRKDMLARVRSGLEAMGVRPDDSLAWDSRRPPYPGLSAFEAADAGVYFGRERDVRAVLDRVHDLATFGSAPRTLVVLGASGTGKSSLLRAGVLPRLALDPRRWFVLPPVRPSQEPLLKLAEALAPMLVGLNRAYTRDEIRKEFKSCEGTKQILRALVGDDLQRTIVVTVDQLEEIATPTADQDLPNWLVGVLAIDQPRILVLGTLRSDRVGVVEWATPLLMRGPLVSIAPLAENDLLRTITGPAEISALELDPDLAQAVLEDVRSRQALPLLAFALRELWERRSPGGRLSTSSYVADLGRIDGAVRRAAEAATKSLVEDPADSEALRVALLEMVQISPDGLVSKRRALISGLPDRSAKGIDALVTARLLVADGEFIEPAHEALFGAWRRLSEWVREARAALMVRTEAQTDADLWERGNLSSEYLWPEARLDRAERLLSRERVGISERARRFLDTSAQAVKQRHKNDEAERNLEVTKLRRQRLIVGAFAAGALVAAAIALGFYVVARNAESQSAQLLRTSLLQTARAACRDVIVGGRDTGIGALKDAVRIRPGDDLRAAYVDCMQKPGLRKLGEQRQVAGSASDKPDGELVHQAGSVKVTLRPAAVNNRFTIWTEDVGRKLASWEIVANQADSIRLSPNGKLVAVVRYPFPLSSQILDIFDARSGSLLWTLSVEPSGLGHLSISSGRISFSESGRYVAVAGMAGAVVAWDLSARDGPVPAMQARPFPDEVLAVAMSPNGRWVAAIDRTNTLAVVEMETSEVVGWVPNLRSVGRADVRALEWTSEDRIVAAPLEWQWLPPTDRGFWARSNLGRQRSVRDVKFDHLGTTLAVAAEYGGIPHIYDLSGRRAKIGDIGPRSTEFPSGVESITFTDRPDLVCGVQLSALLCWEITSGSTTTVATNDFSRWYRQLMSRGDRLVALRRAACHHARTPGHEG